MAVPAGGRLVVVSNRLPLATSRRADGGTDLVAGSGGLVTALGPVMRARGGVWIGWPGPCGDDGPAGERVRRAGREAGYTLVPVPLAEQDLAGFYHGFANEVIWPLFHDLVTLCNFDPGYWRTYLRVIERYAGVVAAEAAPGDLVWVHDYQLMGVGARARALGVAGPLAFFLHIPFPAPDLFSRLPWREPVLRSLLSYDLVGFQAPSDRRNFLACVQAFLPEAVVTSRGALARVAHDGRETRIGRFGIGIDYNDFYRRAATPPVASAAQALRDLLPDRQLILGIDRLDYTKGIPERLLAFADALERYPELRERVTLIQVVVPSRADIPRYRELKSRIENLVGRINGRFTRPGGWVPIHYVFRSLEPGDLLAYYRAAQVALVTPLKDGMNLVAKEYCACSPDEDCVLILSEFAGAAAGMAGAALLVNPHDIEAVADAIHRAIFMPAGERRARMRHLRRHVRRRDVYAWVDDFVRAVPRNCADGSITPSGTATTRPRRP